MPGQYLLRQVTDADENDFLWFVGALFLPFAGGGIIVNALVWLLPSSPSLVLALSLTSFALILLLAIKLLLSQLRRRDDHNLGFFGERYVAECLEPLKPQGWFIFHDIPFDGATGKFNLDHVAVGPGGIWVVETKTRRKGKAKPGRKEHEVEFDGHQLIWPWCEESESLKQAADNARALRDWLQQLTGKQYAVSAVLAIPGYWVVERKLSAVRIANPKLLPEFLIGRGTSLLIPKDIDLIRRQLDSKCRNVEY